MSEFFRKFSNKVSFLAGTVWAFGFAALIVLVWAVTGPVFGFSDTWQLVINTGTTIVTFLMVFLIQNTQNRDNAAFHTKLDELILHTIGAHNRLVEAENLSDTDIAAIKKVFENAGRRGGTEIVNLEKDIVERATNGAGRRRTRSRRGKTSGSRS
jgi:low affinity Fe/Cu permease